MANAAILKKKVPYRYRILIFLFFLTFITYLDRICISIVGVRIKSEFNLTNGQFGWVLASFSLAYALFEIPSGILGDRIGQRVVFIRIVLWWSLFTALTGFATGFISLLCVRFLFGMGEAGAFPNICGVISHWFPANETSRSYSSAMIGINAGSAIAPLIIVPVALAFGWRSTFFLNGFIGLIWVLICFLWFRNNPSEMKGITNEEKTFIEKNRRFIIHRQKFPWKTALKSRSLWSLAIAFFCSQWGLYFFIAWMPVYLQEGRHFSENSMKTITSLLFIFGIGAALLAGMFSDWLVKRKGLKFGRRFLGIVSLGIMGLSFFSAALFSSNTIVVMSLVIGYIFFWFQPTAAFSTCIDIGGNYSGTVAGIMNFFGQMGAFFLAIIFGKIVDITHSFNSPLFVVAAILFTGSLFWLVVDPNKKLGVSGGEELISDAKANRELIMRKPEKNI